jgi:enoyl-CoA hydratase/carnithine racemase
LWLTITREARRNAMSHSLLAHLGRVLREAPLQREVRALVLTGAGDKAFCAGADLQANQAFTTDYSDPHGHLAQVLRAAQACTLPLIARVNGACLAGGMGLMAMCDMAVAAPHARFGLPEVKVGVFPAQVLAVLQHKVARNVLNEWCLCGEPFGADEALRVGLVNYVDADLDGRLHWLLQRLLDKSPAAIRRGLYTLKATQGMSFEQHMAFTESQIALFTLTDDAREGQKAFQEKRAPQWRGN